MLCVLTYTATLAMLSSSVALAGSKYRRVLAATGCHPDETIWTLSFQEDGLLYKPPYVTSVYDYVKRNAGKLRVFPPQDEKVIVRCYVPTDSYLPHHQMSQAHVSGYRAASNLGSYAKACRLWWTNGTNLCGPANTFTSGHFNERINVGSIWSSSSGYPMIIAVLKSGDSLYGIYYTN